LVTKPDGAADFFEEVVLVPKVSEYTGASALLAQTPWAFMRTP